MHDVDALPAGHLRIDGCLNFRDAGGWTCPDGRRMRTGVLYRSDDPIRLQPSGRAAVAALGLSGVVDLRQRSQIDRAPGFLPPERTFHCPLVDRVIDLDDPPELTQPAHVADIYEGMLARSSTQIAAALDFLAGCLAGGPVLVHCVYGKDRTGLVIALIQAAIGLAPADLATEYARSDAPTGRRYRWMLDEPLPGDAPLAKAPPFLFTAPAAAMTMLVDRLIERHGSLDSWVRSLPLGVDTVLQLRAGLLEA